MSTDFRFEDFPEFPADEELTIQSIIAPGVPSGSALEAGVFARHHGVPGHNQEALQKAKIVLVGAGGLNGWVALGLARSGAQNLTVIDPDAVERSNLNRQLYFAEDLRKYKVHCLIQNLRRHMIETGSLKAIPATFQEAVEENWFSADLLIVGVDNNACRLAAVLYARRKRIPAVFTMLSMDGMRCQCFLQGPQVQDPCLWCALPNLNPEKAAPCANSVITSCLLASSYSIFFAHRALMGWPVDVEGFNWCELDLLGMMPSLKGSVPKKNGCLVWAGVE